MRMVPSKGFVMGLLAGVVAGGVYFGARDATGQTTIEFVAEKGAVVIGSADTGDKVIVTGRSAGTTPLGDCSGSPTTEYPSQYGVAVDPSGGRATRMTGLFPVSSTTALKPGTKLTNIQKVSDCTIGGIAYEKFNGTEG